MVQKNKSEFTIKKGKRNLRNLRNSQRSKSINDKMNKAIIILEKELLDLRNVKSFAYYFIWSC